MSSSRQIGTHEIGGIYKIEIMAVILKSGLLIGLALGVHSFGAPPNADSLLNSKMLISQVGSAVYLNDNCQRVAEGSNTWRVDERHPFQAGGQLYWFVLARYQGDASSRLCLTRPGMTQGKPLAVKQLQSQYIDRISQEGNGSSFLIDHRNGNGRAVLITRYRLNLANPWSPTLTQLKQWSQ